MFYKISLAVALCLPLCALALEADGMLLPSKRAKLSISIDARVREVRAEEGALVRKGDVLALLYSEVEELARNRAAVRLKKANYELQVRQELKASRAVANHDVVSAELDAETAKVELEQAEAVLREKTVSAPWDGRVLRIVKKVGEAVNQGEDVLELIDYSVIHVEVYLEARHLNSVQLGDGAEIHGETIGAPERATVELIDPVVEPGSGLFRVRLRLENGDLKLPTGLPVKVRFVGK